MKLVCQKHQAIVDMSLGFTNHDPIPWSDTILSGLVKYFQKHRDDVDHFLTHIFPGIIDLALEVESLLPTEGIPISFQQKGTHYKYHMNKLFKKKMGKIVIRSFLLSRIRTAFLPALNTS